MGWLRDMAISLGCDLDAPVRFTPEERRLYEDGQLFLNKMPPAMDAQEFVATTGRWPTDDDLERVNCRKAGQVGHLSCGWCFKCDGPCFHCPCRVR